MIPHKKDKAIQLGTWWASCSSPGGFHVALVRAPEGISQNRGFMREASCSRSPGRPCHVQDKPRQNARVKQETMCKFETTCFQNAWRITAADLCACAFHKISVLIKLLQKLCFWCSCWKAIFSGYGFAFFSMLYQFGLNSFGNPLKACASWRWLVCKVFSKSCWREI